MGSNTGSSHSHVLILDGNSLSVSDLMYINAETKIQLTEEAWERVRRSRKVVDNLIAQGKVRLVSIHTILCVRLHITFSCRWYTELIQDLVNFRMWSSLPKS